MRVHVTLSKPTTVSIDDDLMGLLGAMLAQPFSQLHDRPEERLKLARTFVNRLAKGNRDTAAEGFSRIVQRTIYRAIAQPEVVALLDGEPAPTDLVQAVRATCVMSEARSTPEALERNRERAAKRERRERQKTKAAIAAVMAEGPTSHADLIRAGDAMFSRPPALPRRA